MRNEHMCFESFTLRTVELRFLHFIESIQCSHLTVDSSTRKLKLSSKQDENYSVRLLSSVHIAQIIELAIFFPKLLFFAWFLKQDVWYSVEFHYLRQRVKLKSVWFEFQRKCESQHTPFLPPSQKGEVKMKVLMVSRVVRKFWSRRLSCQCKRPVQGYFI